MNKRIFKHISITSTLFNLGLRSIINHVCKSVKSHERCKHEEKEDLTSYT
jgi:hypothetical protein